MSADSNDIMWLDCLDRAIRCTNPDLDGTGDALIALANRFYDQLPSHRTDASNG